MNSLTGEFQGARPGKALFCLNIYWESFAKAGCDFAGELLEVPRNVGGCVKNSPDKVLLCFKILAAVYAHQRRDMWIGASGSRRSMMKQQDVRKRSSKARLERKTLATFYALWRCEHHTTLKSFWEQSVLLWGFFSPSSFHALWVIPLYSAKVRKGSSWLPDMRFEGRCDLEGS